MKTATKAKKLSNEWKFRRQVANAYLLIRQKAERLDRSFERSRYEPEFHRANALRDALEFLRDAFKDSHV